MKDLLMGGPAARQGSGLEGFAGAAIGVPQRSGRRDSARV